MSLSPKSTQFLIDWEIFITCVFTTCLCVRNRMSMKDWPSALGEVPKLRILQVPPRNASHLSGKISWFLRGRTQPAEHMLHLQVHLVRLKSMSRPAASAHPAARPPCSMCSRSSSSHSALVNCLSIRDISLNRSCAVPASIWISISFQMYDCIIFDSSYLYTLMGSNTVFWHAYIWGY